MQILVSIGTVAAIARLKYFVIARAITKYLSRATDLNSQHIDPPGRPGNYCQLVSLCLHRLCCTRLRVDVADGIDGDGDGWHSTGAYCTAKLTFSHSSLLKVWERIVQACVLY